MPSLPVLLGLAGLLAAALGVWMLRVLAASREPGDSEPASPGTATAVLERAADRKDELAAGFRQRMRRLREFVPGPGKRYRIPWYLLLGEPGAGKSTLLEHLPLSRPIPREEEGGAGYAWSYFDQAVVIEVDGEVYRSADRGRRSAWYRFLRLLRWHRGERPLDGVVLAVSAEELLASGPGASDRIAEIGRIAFDRLADVQRLLGVRFPVHLLVTKTDRIRGFPAFANALPEEERDEILGWSNPYSLDRAFSPEWVDAAFAGLQQELFRREVEVLATPGKVEDADALFAFASEFRRLRDPLRVVTRELFRQNVYQDGWYFRGIYFTGDARAQPELAAGAHEEPVPVGAASGLPPLEPAGTPPLPIFLRDLFQQKVFAESGLVRPVRTTVFSRRRSVMACQAVLVALVLALPALWLAGLRLERDQAPLKNVLRQVESSQQALRLAGTGDSPIRPAGVEAAQILGLLEAMADIERSSLATPLAPTSYLSRLHGDLSLAMSAAFSNVVLPSLRGALLARADSVFDADPLPQAFGGTLAAARIVTPHDQMTAYLREIRALGEAVARYNTVAFIGADDELRDLAELITYLYDRELPSYFLDRDRYYRDALWESLAPPITDRNQERETVRALGRAQRILGRGYDDLAGHVDEIDLTLQFARQNRLTRAELDRFRQLPERIRLVNAYLADSSVPWLDPQVPLDAAMLALIDSIPENPLFSRERLGRDLVALFNEVRAERVTELDGRGTGVAGQDLIAFDGGSGRTVLAPELVALGQNMDRLMAQPFVRRVDSRPSVSAATPAGGRIAWDVTTLDRAINAHEAFEAFFNAGIEGVSPEFEHVLYLVGSLYLEDNVREMVSAALRTEPAPAVAGRADAERDLAARIASLEPAVERLHRLLQLFQGLGLDVAYADVSDVLALQTAELFRELDRVHGITRPYQPADGSFSTWNGDRAGFLSLYGVSTEEQLDVYLARQRERIGELATRYAQPMIRWLEAEPVYGYASSARGPSFPQGAFDRWYRLLEEVERFEAGTPGGSLAGLESFLRSGSAAIRPPECGGTDGIVGSDYFAALGNELRAALQARCRSLTGAQARARFEALERMYEARFVGRFPFGAPGGPEASPDELRQLFAAAAELEAGHRSALQSLSDGQQAATLLARIDSTRVAFAPLLRDPLSAEPPGLRLRIAFRARRDLERGAEQVVEWRARVGRQTWTQFDPETTVDWRPGDAVEISFRWAANAPDRPAAGSSDRTHRVAFGGRWALPALIAQHGAQATRGEHQLRFVVPLEPSEAIAAGESESQATLWLSIALEDPGSGEPVTVPSFPRTLPRLSAERPAPRDPAAEHRAVLSWTGLAESAHVR